MFSPICLVFVQTGQGQVDVKPCYRPHNCIISEPHKPKPEAPQAHSLSFPGETGRHENPEQQTVLVSGPASLMSSLMGSFKSGYRCLSRDGGCSNSCFKPLNPQRSGRSRLHGGRWLCRGGFGSIKRQHGREGGCGALVGFLGSPEAVVALSQADILVGLCCDSADGIPAFCGVGLQGG